MFNFIGQLTISIICILVSTTFLYVVSKAVPENIFWLPIALWFVVGAVLYVNNYEPHRRSRSQWTGYFIGIALVFGAIIQIFQHLLPIPGPEGSFIRITVGTLAAMLVTFILYRIGQSRYHPPT